MVDNGHIIFNNVIVFRYKLGFYIPHLVLLKSMKDYDKLFKEWLVKFRSQYIEPLRVNEDDKVDTTILDDKSIVLTYPYEVFPNGRDLEDVAPELGCVYNIFPSDDIEELVIFSSKSEFEDLVVSTAKNTLINNLNQAFNISIYQHAEMIKERNRDKAFSDALNNK